MSFSLRSIVAFFGAALMIGGLLIGLDWAGVTDRQLAAGSLLQLATYVLLGGTVSAAFGVYASKRTLYDGLEFLQVFTGGSAIMAGVMMLSAPFVEDPGNTIQVYALLTIIFMFGMGSMLFFPNVKWRSLLATPAAS